MHGFFPNFNSKTSTPRMFNSQNVPESQLSKCQLSKCQLPKYKLPRMSIPKMSTPKVFKHCIFKLICNPQCMLEHNLSHYSINRKVWSISSSLSHFMWAWSMGWCYTRAGGDGWFQELLWLHIHSNHYHFGTITPMMTNTTAIAYVEGWHNQLKRIKVWELIFWELTFWELIFWELTFWELTFWD